MKWLSDRADFSKISSILKSDKSESEYKLGYDKHNVFFVIKLLCAI
jgi:hypothetical protein